MRGSALFLIITAACAAPAAAQPMGGPPPEAFTACDGKAVGDACSHPTPFGTMNGTCSQAGQRLQCKPSRPPGGGNMGGGPGGSMAGGGPALNEQGWEIGQQEQRLSWDDLGVPAERGVPAAFTLPDGRTHWYQAIHLPQGGVNWVQARALAEQAGGYLATIHSSEENEFVFSLIQDRKFWSQWDGSHNYVMNGPFLGGYQPKGSAEPRGGWRWVSGEPWTYEHWAWDGMPGDEDPRPSTQPNDATGNQNVTAFGEVNRPVSTWGDFPHKFSTRNSPHAGKAPGFVIEYETRP